MKELKRNKGITLVALIITIIVLLILAVVAIGAITNGGIINHAKNARTEYEAAQANEQGFLDEYEGYLENVNTPVGGEEVVDTSSWKCYSLDSENSTEMGPVEIIEQGNPEIGDIVYYSWTIDENGVYTIDGKHTAISEVGDGYIICGGVTRYNYANKEIAYDKITDPNNIIE